MTESVKILMRAEVVVRKGDTLYLPFDPSPFSLADFGSAEQMWIIEYGDQKCVVTDIHPGPPWPTEEEVIRGADPVPKDTEFTVRFADGTTKQLSYRRFICPIEKVAA